MHTFPEQFLERLHAINSTDAATVLAALSGPRVMSFRVNTLKAEAQQVAQHLADAGYVITRLPWWNSAFYLPNVEVQQIFHPDYVQGALYVQGLSSMLPPLILDPQPGESVLDLTAAPGSKTTQIAALMKNEGTIFANDVSPVRLFKLQANLKQQGVTIAQVKRGLGELLWRKFPEQFDRTLVDVPCSMEGRFQLDQPKTYQDWSLKKIKELSTRQRQLLRSAIAATKPGGTIVYSTCTLAPEENEAVVQWVLEKEQGKVVLEAINVPHLGEGTQEIITPGLSEWAREQFLPEMSKTLRIYPSPTMEGFFVAKLRKLESTVTPDSWKTSHHFNRRPVRHGKAWSKRDHGRKAR